MTTLHPEAEPVRRNLRKRALLELWLKCPPVVVTFDGGAPGVDIGKGNKEPTKPAVNLNIQGATLGDDAFKCLVKWRDNPNETVEVTVPYAAIHTLSCTPLSETMQWEQDLKAAQARVALYNRPLAKMLH